MTGTIVEVPDGYRAGGWEVTAPIASGSWASVYEARRVRPPCGPDDPPEGLPGALKFISRDLLSPGQRTDLHELIDEEVRFNAEVEHPGLIRTFGSFVVDDPGRPRLHGAVVLAMERAEGDLDGLLDGVPPPTPVPEADRLIREVCAALVHLHAAGWVHGDLKPSNVLRMADGTVRLADFGLARELDGTHAYVPRLGSPDYLPPEWWSERIGEEGIATRPTADIWALGVTAHRLLTGGLFPFPGATARGRAAAAQEYAAGRAPLRLADELPAGWNALLGDCLAPDHARRAPHTAASLLERIDALMAEAATPAPAPPRGVRPIKRPRRRWAVVGTLLLAATIAAAATTLALSLDAPPARTATITVYNAEMVCQRSERRSCRLGVVRDPYATYAPANVVGFVRHGDRLVADCVVPDGTRVVSETGRASTRWYRFRSATGTAWLPGVRVRPGAEPELDRCSA